MLEIYKNFLPKQISEIKALEIGPGDNPLLNEKEFFRTYYIDNEFETNSANKINKNFLSFNHKESFDLIFERLCWHEQNKNDWHQFLDNVINHLAPNGIFISEHAISHERMSFAEDYLEYDKNKMELYSKGINSAIRFIPPSFYIEKTLLSKNLNIKYFKIPFGQKVILNRSNPQTRNTDPDLLQLIAQKST
ncbi:MAG: hypothetical protein CME61_05375 [Halobacteriovoraceae bacterium]|nr:hypothetical protein [Halobacteriovoraceae bacterium]|tara:strand:+ start:121 stop:696 length:576 start_codon:yes stop_codon:yes gene_type:complete